MGCGCSSDNVTGVNSSALISSQMLLQSFQVALEQASSLLKQFGIEMYIYKVKLYCREAEQHAMIDEDAPDASKVVDFVVRIKFADERLANAFREAYKLSLIHI